MLSASSHSCKSAEVVRKNQEGHFHALLSLSSLCSSLNGFSLTNLPGISCKVQHPTFPHLFNHLTTFLPLPPFDTISNEVQKGTNPPQSGVFPRPQAGCRVPHLRQFVNFANWLRWDIYNYSFVSSFIVFLPATFLFFSNLALLSRSPAECSTITK